MKAARRSLAENLRRLSAELDQFVEGREVCLLREAKHSYFAKSVTASLPLGHSQGQATFRSTVKDGFLFSQAELQRQGRKVAGGPENSLGTADDVFTFVGSIRYPLTACALLFAAELERVAANDAIATPFDSGGIVKHFKPTDGSEQGAFLRNHELPVPEYRSYLARMLSVFFQSPLDYVDGNAPDLDWPIPIEGRGLEAMDVRGPFREEDPIVCRNARRLSSASGTRLIDGAGNCHVAGRWSPSPLLRSARAESGNCLAGDAD